MNAAQAWMSALGQLQMDMPKAAFDTWVRDSELVSYEDGVFVVGVHNTYARDWLEDRLTSTIQRLLTGMMNRTVKLRFVVWQQQMEEPHSLPVSELTQSEEAETPFSYNPTINSKYTFDNFVVGASNRLSHAACMAVAEKPARAYNPLFLYGGVGLGKTHLLHAIGNACTEQGLQVLYVSSEEFTNDLIQSIRSHTTQAFRDKYRRIGVLLIDDIQFIAGKESTQEEFFHTFNTLHGQDKQIVMSSDRPPKAMVTLEERLRSRFEWGLTVDTQPPDFETRIAILRAKAERANRQIDSEILALIARRVQSNIRELEGALNRVLAFSDLVGAKITPQLLETALADMFPNRQNMEPDDIVRLVAKQFSVDLERMLSKERSREVALPRQVAMYLLREEANLSLPSIGAILGGRDHTTVLYGWEKITDLLERDDRLRRRVVEIREKIYGRAQYAIA